MGKTGKKYKKWETLMPSTFETVCCTKELKGAELHGHWTTEWNNQHRSTMCCLCRCVEGKQGTLFDQFNFSYDS